MKHKRIVTNKGLKFKISDNDWLLGLIGFVLVFPSFHLVGQLFSYNKQYLASVTDVHFLLVYTE